MTPGRTSPRNPALAGFVLWAAWLLSGCATPQLEQLRARWPATLPERAELTQVEFIAQADYECGPASLAMLLRAAGVATSAEALVPQVYLPGRRGSLQVELLAASRRHGIPAYHLAASLEALLQEVAAGHPVLVFQNLSLPIYPVWHYAVVIGFDRARDTLILHSGTNRRMEVSLATFERTWARGEHWAMVALPVGQLPATAEATPMAAAIAALERVDPAAARRAYAGALQRWPSHPALLLGAGNAAYALGDLAGAAAAYQHAVNTLPQAADAWNNLAQVAMELGRRDQARQAIARAIALGGPRLAAYRALQVELGGP